MVIQFEGVLPEVPHALCIRRLTSMDRSALWLTFPPRYVCKLVHLVVYAVEAVRETDAESLARLLTQMPHKKTDITNIADEGTFKTGRRHQCHNACLSYLACVSDEVSFYITPYGVLYMSTA